MAKTPTEKKYAEIVDSVVTNVIIWDGAAEYTSENEIVLIPTNSPAGIGWGYVNGSFIKPVEEVIPLEEITPTEA